MPPDEPQTIRFGDYELDPANFVLRRGSRRIALERRPMELLLLLVERAGQLVLREDIAARLWGNGFFVDSDAGVNTAIGKIRRALKDSPERPAFVETVAGKGYRFVATLADGTARSTVSLGVLPCTNLTGDPGREYVADGLTEETIAALGQIADARLRVLGRTSMMRLKGARLSIAQLGRRLSTDYLLESAMRVDGETLRVTARLIRTRDEAIVWAALHDGGPAGQLQFERELCAAVAVEIRLRLSPDRMARLQVRQTGSAEAYDLYLRGRQAWNQLTPATTRHAVECFSRAVAIDADYALAWSGISDALTVGPITGDVDPLLIRDRATDAAVNAARARPDLAEGHASMGAIKFWLDWSWAAAETALRRAINLDPHYPFAFRMLGHVLSQSGQHHAARLALQRAVELDPFYAMHHALSAQVAFQARDYAAAIAHAEHALEVDPRFWIGYLQLAQAAERLGESEQALDALTSASPLASANSKVESLKGYVLAATDRRDEALTILAALEHRAGEQYVPPYAIALVNLGLGRREAAYKWLGRAVAARDVHVVYLPVDPKWDACRGDSAFVEMLESLGMPVSRA